MDRRDATRLSKFLSLVLRHRPDEYRLEMDELGFVDFDGLMDVLAAEDVLGDNAEEDVLELVNGSDRRRFEIDEGRIRALYGHSSRIDLNYPDEEPPETLYHGTTVEAARSVAEEGLKPAGRAYVHLSSTEEEALAIGRRHTDDPVLLRVDTAGAREHGVRFHQATELIWLCNTIPADACRIPDLPESASRAAPPAPRPSTPRPSAPPAPESRPSGAQVVEADPSEGFKRRTRKKGGRRR